MSVDIGELIKAYEELEKVKRAKDMELKEKVDEFLREMKAKGYDVVYLNKIVEAFRNAGVVKGREAFKNKLKEWYNVKRAEGSRRLIIDLTEVE